MNHKPRGRFLNRSVQVAAVVLLAFLLRTWAAWQLPVDYDEPTYIGAALHYIQAVQQDGIAGVVDFKENREHPPLVKLLFAGMIQGIGGTPSFTDALFPSRMVSVVFGSLSVFLVALLDPLAGLLFALHSMTIKYTSQAYLEALPQMAALGAVFFLLKSRHTADRNFWLSAVFLGLTAAGKYSFAPILAPILFIYFAVNRASWKYLLPYLAVSGLVFFSLDPSLWRDPLRQLGSSLSFHAQYSQGSDVQRADYPWYQSFVWFTKSYPAYWHPKVFFYFPADGWISLFALIALRWDWKKRPWLVVWSISSLLFLLIWPTKWPQYTLVLSPAICLMSASTLRFSFEWLREKEAYWGVLENLLPHPPRWVKILAWTMITAALLGQVLTSLSAAYVTRGWWHLSTTSTPLPSNMIYSILPPDAEGQMAFGTGRGLVLADISNDTHYPDHWQVFTPQNSALPGYVVQTMIRDAGGTLWVGTNAGLAALNNGSWSVYHETNSGLPADNVQVLALGSDGLLWIATARGVAAFDGQNWRVYAPPLSSDLFITALAIQPTIDGEIVWVGSASSLGWMDPSTGNWNLIDRSAIGLGAGGISRLMIDSRNRLWVATLGGGLACYDGSSWAVFNITNSNLPYNTVVTVTEIRPDIFWIGVAPPTEVGGILTRYDGKTWSSFEAGRSGFSGSNPTVIVLDSYGRLWIGTRSHGVDVYLHGN
jgi:hypothetical protein